MSDRHSHSPRAVSERASRMPSFDLYGGIHRGLRWSHAQLMQRLGAISPGDRAQTEGALAELEDLLVLCLLHLGAEDGFYHPALERRRPGSTTSLVVEHEQHRAGIAELRALAAVVGTDPARWRGLYLAYTRYVCDDLAHMADEEARIQPLFDELYSAAELRQLNDELVAAYSPAEKLSLLRIMLPAASREGRVALLGAVRAALPPGPFQGLLAALAPALAEAEFQQLKADLDAAGPA
jgi:hypothetical protein